MLSISYYYLSQSDYLDNLFNYWIRSCQGVIIAWNCPDDNQHHRISLDNLWLNSSIFYSKRLDIDWSSIYPTYTIK